MSRSGIAFANSFSALYVAACLPADKGTTVEETSAMSEAIKLAAFCGSLRKGSFNRMALHAFIERAPKDVTVETIEIGDWPLYNADIQAQGFPDKVQAAQKAMLAADGILFVTPEYNYGISGVLKNAIDWLSRMTPQPFAGKTVGMMGASGGVLGTARAQYQLRQTLVFLDGRPINKPEIMIGVAQNKFADGKLTDEATGKMLVDFGVALAFAIRQAKAAATVK
jgi:chromate reductase